MTLREYLEMEKLIHKRAVPSDILLQMRTDVPDDEYQYFSKTSNVHVNIFDMHLHHLVRAFAKINATSDNGKLEQIKKILEVA